MATYKDELEKIEAQEKNLMLRKNNWLNKEDN